MTKDWLFGRGISCPGKTGLLFQEGCVVRHGFCRSIRVSGLVTCLYVASPGFLMARVLQHKSGECAGFTQRYKVNRLVYYEVFQYVNNAIARETEIKKWRREKKVALL